LLDDPHDVTTRRAHCLEDPDLARALSDRGVHREHHHERTHHCRQSDEYSQEHAEIRNTLFKTCEHITGWLNHVARQLSIDSLGDLLQLSRIVELHKDERTLIFSFDRFLHPFERQLYART